MGLVAVHHKVPHDNCPIQEAGPWASSTQAPGEAATLADHFLLTALFQVACSRLFASLPLTF